jgi:hypothetical protein
LPPGFVLIQNNSFAMLQNSRSKIILFLVIIIVIIAAGSFIPFSHSIKAPCVLLPLKKWTISQPEPDKIVVNLINNQSGFAEHFTAFQYNRPDVVHFQLGNIVKVGRQVSKGDTVAQIQSSEEHLELTRLMTALETAKTNIASLKAGEKPALRKEAEQALEYATAQKIAHIPQVERRRELFSNGLITREDLELAESDFKLLQINEKIQKAMLDGLSTGVKQEQITVVESQIAGLQKQINISRLKMDSFKFVSPIDGYISKSLDPLILVNISQIDTLVAQILVPIDKSNNLSVGQPTKITFKNQKLYTTLYSISPIAQHISGNTLVLTTALIVNSNKLLKPNQPVFAKINCGKWTLKKVITNEWSTFKSSRLN